MIIPHENPWKGLSLIVIDCHLEKWSVLSCSMKFSVPSLGILVSLRITLNAKMLHVNRRHLGETQGVAKVARVSPESHMAGIILPWCLETDVKNRSCTVIRSLLESGIVVRKIPPYSSWTSKWSKPLSLRANPRAKRTTTVAFQTIATTTLHPHSGWREYRIDGAKK